MDARAQQARERHRLAGEHDEIAAMHRRQRDRLIRILNAEDPRRWSYRNLAGAIGCSWSLIAVILKHGDDDGTPQVPVP